MPAPEAAAAGAPPAPLPSADACLKALYSVMQSLENKLGGGEGVEGLYGSIKRGGMDKVLECLRDKCCLDSRSVLVDIGAGLGRPLMHALLEPGIAGARGVEIDRIKCDKADAFLRQAVLELQRRGVAPEGLVPPPIQCSAIEDVRSLDPCTHAYSFWEGVPIDGKAAFGALFAASRTLRSVAVVQRAIRTCPLEYMEDLGFGELVLVGSFAVSMSGSGRSFTAYVFNKAHLPAELPAVEAAEAAAAASVGTPAQAAEAAAVAAAAEVEGEGAESRLAEAAGATTGRGRRQRRPSAKAQAAEVQAQAQVEQPGEQVQLEQPQHVAQVAAQPRSARDARSDRRKAAVWDAAKAASQQLQQQPKPQPEQHQAAAAAAAGAAAEQPLESPRKSPRNRSTSRPAATAAAAAKLSSPQKAGVQKRASPSKTGSAASGRSPQKTATSRQLPLASPAAAKEAAAVAAAQNVAPGSAGGVLQRAARVIKSSLIDSVSKLRPTRAAAGTRRGLQTDRMAA